MILENWADPRSGIVPQSHKTGVWGIDRLEAIGDTSVRAQRRRIGFQRRCRSLLGGYQGSDRRLVKLVSSGWEELERDLRGCDEVRRGGWGTLPRAGVAVWG